MLVVNQYNFSDKNTQRGHLSRDIYCTDHKGKDYSVEFSVLLELMKSIKVFKGIITKNIRTG